MAKLFRNEDDNINSTYPLTFTHIHKQQNKDNDLLDCYTNSPMYSRKITNHHAWRKDCPSQGFTLQILKCATSPDH